MGFLEFAQNNRYHRRHHHSTILKLKQSQSLSRKITRYTTCNRVDVQAAVLCVTGVRCKTNEPTNQTRSITRQPNYHREIQVRMIQWIGSGFERAGPKL